MLHLHSRWLTAPGLFLLATLLSACSSFGLYSPVDKSSVLSPVNVEVRWSPANGERDLKILLNTTDITSQFVRGTRDATAQLTLPAGSYTLEASAIVYDPLYRKESLRRATTMFTVTPPASRISLTVIPDPIMLLPGANQTLDINVTRAGGAAASPEPVRVTLTGLPSAVTATPQTTSIAASDTSASVTLTTPAQAQPASGHAVIDAETNSPAGTISTQERVALRIARRPSDFQSARISAFTVGTRVNSPDQRYVLEIVPGANAGLATALAARFKPAGSATPLLDIGFNMGRLLSLTQSHGGAGFCGGSTVGFAVAGVNPNMGVVAGTDFVVFASRLQANAVQARVEAWGVRPPILGQPATYAFAPQAWFTSDCSMLMVLSAQSAQSGGERHLATFVDMASGSTVCSLAFDQDPTAAGFRARLVNTPSEDRIELIADSATRTCSVR